MPKSREGKSIDKHGKEDEEEGWSQDAAPVLDPFSDSAIDDTDIKKDKEKEPEDIKIGGGIDNIED